MLKTGAMDRFGTIEKPFVLAEGEEPDDTVAVIQQDVREIQMAKAAIAAGAKALLAEVGLTLEELSEVGVAGAFGSAIRAGSAVDIGLLPKVDLSKIVSLGNAAGVGASMMLLSGAAREEAERIAASVEHVELAASTDFQTRYIEEMNF